ncbi:tectonin beta-propeller repeat-containing protein 1 isoform X1 [Stegostoma tigrinum]|uniref:tectonin beta-propeller repeat-containing protein 1 isoform X1 n=1 Tax=Stegostoma tigrinum TaxID=3053191 RepID=UPI00202AC63F|nr:tectonin beta-propeller repeat-containing protein 1 isoform X1 [Stegostoma tigrinum]
MPSSLLWAVDVHGRVCSLSTAGQCWELCKDESLQFKRLAAVKQCCWGIACDHQIYVYVHSSEVPIHFQEETYENQRWNPVNGFSDRLLPSDRWQWSDVTGLIHQPLDEFKLASPHWEWESDWYVDENIGGEPTEKGGWTYAIDFPATYTKDRRWNSCVRRRRWIRYRRYNACDMWAKIPLQEAGPLPDPFNDIAVGGWEITDEPLGHLSVWAVTVQGKVFYRENINDQNPEGSMWTEIQTPGEVVQITCGPGDLLCAVLWEGQLMVREGVNRENPKGSSWKIVEPPNSENGLVQVSVGINVLWAITRDRKVWFRRGVCSENPVGTGWICMNIEMVMVNVGLNDQVWGIGYEDRNIYFRHGVTPTEYSGKAWKVIVASREHDQASRTGSATSLASAGCFFGDEVRLPSQVSISSEVDFSLEMDKLAKKTENVLETIGDRAGCLHASGDGDGDVASRPEIEKKYADVANVFETIPLMEVSSEKWTQPVAERSVSQAPYLMDQGGPLQHGAELIITHSDSNTNTMSSDLAETSSVSSVGTYPFGIEEHCVSDERPLWAWVSGGGCEVEAHAQLNWFTPQSGQPFSQQSFSMPVSCTQQTVWRKQIVHQLTERSKRELQDFKHYEQAVEQSVWIKKGAMQWWRDGKPHKWIDVKVALEQFTGNDGKRDGIFFIYYTFNDEKKYLHVFSNEITILVPMASETKHSFAIYTPDRTKQRWPIRLATTTEQEMYDWLAVLSLACCDSRDLHGPPSNQALWSVTCKGDIFISEPTPNLEAAQYLLPSDQLYWRQIGGHLRIIESNSQGIVWGIGYDHTAWVYTGGYGGGFFQGLASSTDNIYTQTDIMCVYIYENQRWNPVTGYSSRGLPTDRYMWSDASGLQECTKAHTKPPSQWTWVSDWYIDFNAPGGTDREGWQFAADFPASYHGYKTIKDFVRRRRWARKCKIVTTGPWFEVGPVALRDISLIPCVSQKADDASALWAISSKGDVLCRLGITKQNALGISWLHIGTDQPFVSVSIGGYYQVWAIARDGAAFYRGSVSPQNCTGDCWYHIPPPSKQKLIQVSVGQTSVYTVDENGNLWFRQSISPSYPQGSYWQHVSTNVRKVSVGPLDQVWIVADKVQGSHSLSCGTVCHRMGVQPREPTGSSWDYGIGGGWDHITIRANSMESSHNLVPMASDNTSMNLPNQDGTVGDNSSLIVDEQQERNGSAFNC